MKRTEYRMACAALLGLPALLYARALGYGLLGYDDDIFYRANPALAGGSLRGAWLVWTRTYFSEYIPVTQFTHWLDLCVAGDGNWWFARLQQVLWLCAAILGLHALLRRLCASEGPSFAAALFLAAHPVALTSVAWLAERKNLVCAALLFWAFERYLAARADGDPRSSRWKWLAALGLFVLALLAKIHAVALPAMLLAWEALLARDAWKPRLRAWLPFAALAGVFLVASLGWIRQDLDGGYLGGGRMAALASGGPVVLRYLAQTVWPINLPFFYAVEGHAATAPQAWFAWFGAAAVLAGVCRLAAPEDRRLAIFGCLWGLAGIAPALNLVPQPVAMADHYHFWALPGWLLSLSLAGRGLLARVRVPRTGVTWVAAGAALSLIALSWLRLGLFAAPQELYRHSTACEPESALAWAHLALEQREAGDGKSREDAGASAQRALDCLDAGRILPTVRNQLALDAATRLAKAGRLEEARALAERECAKLPARWKPLGDLTLARVAVLTGRPLDAVLRLAPHFSGALPAAAARLRAECRAGRMFPFELPPQAALIFEAGEERDRRFSRTYKLEALRCLAEALLAAGEAEAAFDVAAVIVNQAPEDSPARTTLALVYQQLHLPDAARRAAP